MEHKLPVRAFSPSIRYADAPAAIAWLAAAFGFREAVCRRGTDGSLVHAELSFADGVVIVASVRAADDPVATPGQRGGITASMYASIPPADIDAHYARAIAAGARIHVELQATDYAARFYSAFDPEGHLWAFGTYVP